MFLLLFPGSSLRATFTHKRHRSNFIALTCYTDIATDGMMKGPNFKEMELMSRASSIPLVASGGVTRIGDVARLAELGIPACIIGRALYEKTIDLAEALKYEV